MLHGWIKLHRQLLDHWSASEPEMLATWVRLLLEANHQDAKKVINGTLVDIKRGQLLFGYNAFSTKSGVTKKKLERYMKLFEAEGMLGRQRGSKYSLITITCYEDYQTEGGKGEAEGKQKGSTGEHRKNVKNDNNEKKEDITPKVVVDFSLIKMTDDELTELKRIRRKNKGGAITQRVANALAKEFDLARSNGLSNDDILTEWEVRGWKSFKAEWVKSTFSKPNKHDLSNTTYTSGKF